ncbi:MAG: ATP phosphoribosyltransferase [Phycisphaerales bacterium JB043]
MMPLVSENTVRFAIPKGRMQEGVLRLLREAGINVSASARNYRPTISLDGFELKVLKPRAIVEMLDAGARDCGFAGADWVAEAEADVVELLDTGLDPVRLIAAAPDSVLVDGRLPSRPLVFASEYMDLTRRWMERSGLDGTLLRSYGATEVLPPEDADCIVDNTATGSTLAANNLTIIDELMTSSTRLYASRHVMEHPQKREMIERLVLVVRAVLEARTRVMVEVNVSSCCLDAVIGALPCMREPTVSALRSESGFAVKAAVPRADLARVIPVVRQRGGTDIVVTTPEQIVP